MNGLPHGTPIYLCTVPIDFRKGFDGLTGIVTAPLGHSVDPRQLTIEGKLLQNDFSRAKITLPRTARLQRLFSI